MLITHANIITWNEQNAVLDDGAVWIQNGRIAEIGDTQTLLAGHPDTAQVDAGGQWLMPGNICAHTHFYGAFARGMAVPGPAPKDFPEILRRLWWPLDQALDEQAVRLSAQIMLADAIRNGVTTLFDHHASPNALAGSLDVIAEQVLQAGVRASLCYEVTDRYGVESTQAAIQENSRFIDRLRQNPHDRLAAAMGVHASLTVSEDTLAACRNALPDGFGFHIHAAEHFSDQDDSLQKSGQRVIDRLSRHGVLGPESILAHGVYVDAREIMLLAESGVWVTHQPRSNMNNAVGAAPVESMLRAGVRLTLGTDGFPHAMWEEWRAAYLLHKVWHRDPRRMNGMDVVQMAIKNQAEMASRFFSPAKLGVIAPGAAADLILVDYHAPTPVTAGNLPWHILFGFYERMITATMVAGKFLMKNRELLTMDEAKIAAEARQTAPKVWEKFSRI